MVTEITIHDSHNGSLWLAFWSGDEALQCGSLTITHDQLPTILACLDKTIRVLDCRIRKNEQGIRTFGEVM